MASSGRTQDVVLTPINTPYERPIESTSRFTALLEWILRLPLVWGGVASMAFYAALHQRWIDSQLLRQYMASHPVEYTEGVVFFIGIAALMIRLAQVAGQFAQMGRVELPPIPRGGQPLATCDLLLFQLAELPRSMQQSYLVRRLREALEHVRRKDSADSIEAHLRHLEEVDAGRMYGEYTLVRIIIWAIPILGLLGTVIGITLAIGHLDPKTLEESLGTVTKGLGVAFDHTGEALTLTMILMLVKYLVEKTENRLLELVDARAAEELVGRFKYTGAEDDPNVAAIRRMSGQVIEAVESLAARQADVWKSAIEQTHQQWAEVSASAGNIVRESLTASLGPTLDQHAQRLNEGVARHADRLSQSSETTVVRLREGLEKLAELLVESLHKHGEVLTASEKDLAEENRKHLSEVENALGESMVRSADRQENLIRRSEELLKEMQMALVNSAENTIRQQEQLIKQGDVLLQVVDATGQVERLEEALNKNLSTLSQSQAFDEMALNLTAAIQMLCARIGHSTGKQAPALVPATKTHTGQAA
jgi:biopolymer transport protein ExbB/TolQ